MKGGQGHFTTEMDSKGSGMLWTPTYKGGFTAGIGVELCKALGYVYSIEVRYS